MRIANPFANLKHKLNSLQVWKRAPPPEEHLKIRAINILHHDVDVLWVSSKIVNGDDVGVNQVSS